MPSSAFQTCALDRKSTRLNSSHTIISYAVFCLKKKTELSDHVAAVADRYVEVIYMSSRSRCPSDSHPPLVTRSSLMLDSSARRCFFFFNDRATPEISPLSLPAALPINDTATTEIYTLSLPDALPISVVAVSLDRKRVVYGKSVEIFGGPRLNAGQP